MSPWRHWKEAALVPSHCAFIAARCRLSIDRLWRCCWCCCSRLWRLRIVNSQSIFDSPQPTAATAATHPPHPPVHSTQPPSWTSSRKQQQPPEQPSRVQPVSQAREEEEEEAAAIVLRESQGAKAGRAIAHVVVFPSLYSLRCLFVSCSTEATKAKVADLRAAPTQVRCSACPHEISVPASQEHKQQQHAATDMPAKAQWQEWRRG